MPERPDNQVIAEIEAKSCRILFIARHEGFGKGVDFLRLDNFEAVG